MKVVKRDGRIVDYDKSFIKNAITKAFLEVRGKSDIVINQVTDTVEAVIFDKYTEDKINIEEIQDLVESTLMSYDLRDVAKAYIIYRQRRSDRRQSKSVLSRTIAELAFGNSEDNDDKRENANINADAPIS